MIDLLKIYKNPKNMLDAFQSSKETTQLIRGWITTETISTLMHFGFFDNIDKGIDIKKWVRKKRFKLEVVNYLVNYLYATKILDKRGNKYYLSKKGKRILKYTSGLFTVYHGAYLPVFHNLEKFINGKLVYGKNVEREGEALARGSGDFGRILLFPLVTKIIKERGFKKVMDLGCGDCEFLIKIAKEDVVGVGIDISKGAVKAAQEHIKKEGMEKAISVIHADAFKPAKLPKNKVSDIDAITSFLTLHEFLLKGPSFVKMVLSSYKKRFPGKYFILVEANKLNLESLRKSQRLNIEYQLVHNLTLQGLASEEEWKNIFYEVGIKVEKIEKVPVANINIYLLKL